MDASSVTAHSRYAGDRRCPERARRLPETANLVRALVEGDYANFILCHARRISLIKGCRKDAGLTDNGDLLVQGED